MSLRRPPRKEKAIFNAPLADVAAGVVLLYLGRGFVPENETCCNKRCAIDEHRRPVACGPTHASVGLSRTIAQHRSRVGFWYFLCSLEAGLLRWNHTRRLKGLLAFRRWTLKRASVRNLDG